MKLRVLIVLLPLLLLLLVPASFGQIATVVPLPANLQGELNGVPHLIRVPANWNGTLLVYSYGYADADANTAAPPLTPLPTDVNTLLSRGFALAGVHAAGGVTIPPFTEAGWNFKERMQNTVALTAAFREMVGQPRRTIAWGRSMGGLVALALVEKFPGLYDGAIALCPPAAGTPRVFDQKLDITLAYAAAFDDWNDAWGAPGNLRPDLNFMTEVLPTIQQHFPPDTPVNLGRWEFLRRVNRIPLDNSFYKAVPPFTTMPFLFQTLWLAFAPQVDLNKRAGGQVAENFGRVYTLSEDDKSALAALGVDYSTLLEQMNEQAIYKSDRNARNYAAHYFNPSGRITRPVLTLHTTGDAAAIPNNESAYYNVVEGQGNEDLLMQVYSDGIPGVLNTHVTFLPAQYFAAIDAMMYWLDTGNRPNPSVYFPQSLGFTPNYVVPKWPW